jgi:hypothetical protein
MTVELSARPEADLFLLRQYVFTTGMKYADFEQQLAFVQESAAAISDWLGMEMVGSDGAGGSNAESKVRNRTAGP